MTTATAGVRATPEAIAQFDESGFLIDPRVWTSEIAEHTARLDGIGELTERHWRVIYHMRDRFFRIGGLPSMRLVCRATDVNREEIYRLFGTCKAIWRIAGLPDPGEEAKSYLG